MKRGSSYITVTDKKHQLVKALFDKGYTDVVLIYASHFSSDSGWNIVKSNKGAFWLGFTKKEALKFINQL